jgi:hypothetical protein
MYKKCVFGSVNIFFKVSTHFRNVNCKKKIGMQDLYNKKKSKYGFSPIFPYFDTTSLDKTHLCLKINISNTLHKVSSHFEKSIPGIKWN